MIYLGEENQCEDSGVGKIESIREKASCSVIAVIKAVFALYQKQECHGSL